MYIYIDIYIYAIMKTMCPPGYHHNGMSCHKAIAVNPSVANLPILKISKFDIGLKCYFSLLQK